jgi:hypothetical protein
LQKRCSEPSTNSKAVVENCNPRGAGYCVTAPVFNVGKVLIIYRLAITSFSELEFKIACFTAFAISSL